MAMKVPYKQGTFNAPIDYEKLIEMQANTEYQDNGLKQNQMKVMKKTRKNKRMPNARRGV